jgi:hypothetical protein
MIASLAGGVYSAAALVVAGVGLWIVWRDGALNGWEKPVFMLCCGIVGSVPIVGSALATLYGGPIESLAAAAALILVFFFKRIGSGRVWLLAFLCFAIGAAPATQRMLAPMINGAFGWVEGMFS